MNKILLTILIALFLVGSVSFAADEIYIDAVTGLVSGNTLPLNQDITFQLRYVYSGGLPGNILASSNGFRLHSADATWSSFAGVAAGAFSASFTSGAFTNINPPAETPYLSGADTIGFAGIEMGMMGMGGIASGYSGIMFSITVNFPSSEAGKTVALDTSWFGNSGDWVWSNDGWQSLAPGWGGGPFSTYYNVSEGYVFILEGGGSCCVGIRGNVNGDVLDEVDIADVTFLVKYAFKQGPVPPCEEEADCNADLSLDIADLTYLVKYAFKSGPAPVACP